MGQPRAEYQARVSPLLRELWQLSLASLADLGKFVESPYNWIPDAVQKGQKACRLRAVWEQTVRGGNVLQTPPSDLLQCSPNVPLVRNLHQSSTVSKCGSLAGSSLSHPVLASPPRLKSHVCRVYSLIKPGGTLPSAAEFSP